MKKAFLSLFIVAFIWGVAGVVIKHTLDYISPIGFLFARYLATVAIFAVFFYTRGVWSMVTEAVRVYTLPRLILLSFVGSTAFLTLVFYAYQYSTAFAVTSIIATAPILVNISGVVFLQERVTRRELLGAVTILCGFVVFLVTPYYYQSSESVLGVSCDNSERVFVLDKLAHCGSMDTVSFGNMLAVISLVCWVFYTIYSKKLVSSRTSNKPNFEGYRSAVLSFWTFAVGLVTTLPLFLYDYLYLQNSIDIGGAWYGVAYMAVFSSAIAYSLYQYGASQIEVSLVSLFDYIQPLFALPVAVYFLQEQFYTAYIAGFVLVLLGFYIEYTAQVSEE